MRKQQHFYKSWCVRAVILLFAACSEDNLGEVPNPSNSNESVYFVDEAAVSSIASYLKFSASPELERSGVSGLPTEKEIETLTPIMGEDGLPTCYVINYKGGGFIIMAADKRVEPILAFSEENSFPVDVMIQLEGVSIWLDNAKETVELIRQNKLEAKDNVELAWDMQSMQGMVAMSGDPMEPMDPDEWGPCPQGKTVGPLLRTRWDQGA